MSRNGLFILLFLMGCEAAPLTGADPRVSDNPSAQESNPAATPPGQSSATSDPASPQAPPAPTDTSIGRYRDPGRDPWVPVPRDRVAEECGLDPDLLEAADKRLGKPYAVVRHGKLCHEHYPLGRDSVTHVFSATKTLGAVVVGRVATLSKGLPRTGKKTGPLSDEDLATDWLDSVSFNQQARVAHVLAMVAHNSDLAFGAKRFSYDTVGSVQINRLSDILNTVIKQSPAQMGVDLDELTRKHFFEPMGMTESSWSGTSSNKIFAYTWNTTLKDMARLGLLVIHQGFWNGERLIDAGWIYRLTHPAFEDASTGYGYLTWLNSRSNFANLLGAEQQAPGDPCAPASLHRTYPHTLSGSPDCNYKAPYTCDQTHDVGLWFAAGMGGHYIAGHRGLDLVLVLKDFGQQSSAGPRAVWAAVRPALVALDPKFKGNEQAFCDAYGTNAYAPDLVE